MSQTKSQSDDLREELLQQLHNIQDDYSKRREHVRYIHAISGRSLVEDYRDGNVALILDVPAGLNGNKVWRFLGSPPSTAPLDFTSFIFQLNAINGGKTHNWDQEPMFVENVEFVNGADGGIIPSVVRLYIGNDEFKECRGDDVYFSPVQRVFKLILGGVHGKFGELADCRGDKSLDGSYPCMVKSALLIMNSVSNHQCKVSCNVRIAKIMFDDLVSNVRVSLDCGSVGIWQRANASLNIGDVLIGPFKL